MERQVAESNTFIAELIGNMGRARRTVSELRQRAIARQQEYHKEVETQQAEVSREVLGDYEKFVALRDELGRTEIRSPASGQVVALVAQTVGGVIAPGQKLMDVVPVNEPLLLETRVPPHLIDRIRAGIPVDVRFSSSFAHSPQLVVQGKLVSVSGDLLTDPQTNTSYYLARRRRDAGGPSEARQAFAAAGHAGRGGLQDRGALAARLPLASAHQAHRSLDDGRMKREEENPVGIRCCRRPISPGQAWSLDLSQAYAEALEQDSTDPRGAGGHRCPA